VEGIKSAKAKKKWRFLWLQRNVDIVRVGDKPYMDYVRYVRAKDG